MKRTSIRELKHDTTKVLSWVSEGETVEIRRRDVPVALLSPPVPETKPERPDFAARLTSIYGDQVLAVTATELISEDRGER